MWVRVAVGLLVVGCAACAEPAPAKVPAREGAPIFASTEARAIVDAPDRTAEDRQLDSGRRPAELLTFLGIRPHMRVGELMAGAGYTAELLARASAPGGVVYAENHDLVWMGVDRRRMNAAVFVALRKGGRYAVIDHSAAPGAGTTVAHTLHRIDEAVVRTEVQQAGFVLEGGDSFLRNPSDTRDWNDSPPSSAARRGTSDRFALVFRKP